MSGTARPPTAATEEAGAEGRGSAYFDINSSVIGMKRKKKKNMKKYWGSSSVVRNNGFPFEAALLTRRASQAPSRLTCSPGSVKWLSIYFKRGKLRMVFQCYCWLSYVKRFLRRVIIGAVFRNSLVTNA